MSAVIGLLLFTMAVLVFGMALILARRPDAAIWLTEGFVATLITITTIALAAMGLGLVGQFAVSYGREPLSFNEGILIGTSLIVLTVVFAVIGRVLRQRPPQSSPKVEPVTAVHGLSAQERAATITLRVNAADRPSVTTTRDGNHQNGSWPNAQN